MITELRLKTNQTAAVKNKTNPITVTYIHLKGLLVRTLYKKLSK